MMICFRSGIPPSPTLFHNVIYNSPQAARVLEDQSRKHARLSIDMLVKHSYPSFKVSQESSVYFTTSNHQITEIKGMRNGTESREEEEKKKR